MNFHHTSKRVGAPHHLPKPLRCPLQNLSTERPVSEPRLSRETLSSLTVHIVCKTRDFRQLLKQKAGNSPFKTNSRAKESQPHLPSDVFYFFKIRILYFMLPKFLAVLKQWRDPETLGFFPTTTISWSDTAASTGGSTTPNPNP